MTPIARPIVLSRFPASELVSVPVWARAWQEALPVPKAPAGGRATRGDEQPTPFSLIHLPSVVVLHSHQPRVALRLRRDEVRAIQVSLSERDERILRSFQVMPLLSGDQLERLHFADLESSSRDRRRRDVLQRLTKLRVLERLPRRVGGVRSGSSGHVYGLGLVGERILDEDVQTGGALRSRWRGGSALVTHTLGSSEVWVRAVEAERAGKLSALAFVPEPGCWQNVDEDEPWTLKPDALISWRQNGRTEHWFVEIDRGTESPSTLQKKTAAYEAAWEAGLQIDGVMPRLWWVALR